MLKFIADVPRKDTPARVRPLDELRSDAALLLRECATLDAEPVARGRLQERIGRNKNQIYVRLATNFVHFDVLGCACEGSQIEF